MVFKSTFVCSSVKASFFFACFPPFAEIPTQGLLFGIASQLKKYPSELSGGQRQRVAAARAMVKRPPLIFADEPTGALDSSSATELLSALSEVNQAIGTTILMVTHDPYAASYTDRILYFKDGHIISELRRHNRERRDFYEEIMREVSRQDEKR